MKILLKRIKPRKQYQKMEISVISMKVWSRTFMFQQIFAKLKLSPVVFKKIAPFVCLVFENEDKWILKL